MITCFKLIESDAFCVWLSGMFSVGVACDELRAEVFYGFSNLRHGMMPVGRLIRP